MGNILFQKVEFEVFRQRLLLRQLDEVGIWEAHAQIMREADTAGDIAINTPYPSLVFPCLFEERVLDVLERFRKREATYWDSFRSIVNNL